LVEHTTENRGVAGSIPALAISGCRMAAGFLLPRVPAQFASMGHGSGHVARLVA
jgi:hypothetical protein